MVELSTSGFLRSINYSVGMLLSQRFEMILPGPAVGKHGYSQIIVPHKVYQYCVGHSSPHAMLLFELKHHMRYSKVMDYA